MEDERLRLKWDDFQENLQTHFRELRDDSDFTDVTLVCEDGKLVRGHKIILSAGSSMIRKLLASGPKPSHLLKIPAPQHHILPIVRYCTSAAVLS